MWTTCPCLESEMSNHTGHPGRCWHSRNLPAESPSVEWVWPRNASPPQSAESGLQNTERQTDQAFLCLALQKGEHELKNVNRERRQTNVLPKKNSVGSLCSGRNVW